jgi:hypothetical protein
MSSDASSSAAGIMDERSNKECGGGASSSSQNGQAGTSGQNAQRNIPNAARRHRNARDGGQGGIARHGGATSRANGMEFDGDDEYEENGDDGGDNSEDDDDDDDDDDDRPITRKELDRMLTKFAAQIRGGGGSKYKKARKRNPIKEKLAEEKAADTEEDRNRFLVSKGRTLANKL